MILGRVTGKIVSNQKTEDLMGAILLLVTEIDVDENLIKDRVHVAVDKVGAGNGDIVLVGEFSTPMNVDVYQDNMSIIAIVEHIQTDG